MLEIFSTLLTGVLSGGATGLLGVLLQRFFDHKAKALEIEVIKLNHANSLELARLENERADNRNRTDLELASVQLEGEQAEQDAQNLRAAFAHDRATYLPADALVNQHWTSKLVVLMFGFVDTLRGVIRPGMTAYLCVLVTFMFYWVKELAKEYGLTLSPEQVYQLMLQIVTTILYVFTVTTLFWFGTRGKSTK